MKTWTRTLGLFAIACCLAGAVTAQSTIYVDTHATGADTGQSWQDAFVSLQDALSVADAGDEIWVSSGVYTPHDSDRSISFDLVDGVRMYGGFAGSESSPGERQIGTAPTVLSGDLSVPDDGFSARVDNSFHVVTAQNIGQDTLLEGFIIRAGHANGADADSLGGGLLIMDGEPTIMNVHFVGNYGRCGGGVAVMGGSPELVNVVMNGNRALRGGGMCAVNANGTLTNATITANSAESGAGVYHRDASPTYANSILSGNSRTDMIPRCALMQYPCTLADMPDDVDAETRALLTEAHDVLAEESLDNAEQLIAAHPDVVELHRDGDALMFRLRGGTPTYLWSYLVDDVSGPGKHGGSPPVLHAGKGAGAHVVGEDTNLDGVVDNRDQKRALVLAPHEWDFAPNDEARIIRAALGSIEDYQGAVEFNANPEALDQNFSLDDYSSWDEYDFIYLSTHGQRFCIENEFTQVTECGIGIQTGIRVSDDERLSIQGVVYVAAHNASQSAATSGNPNVVQLLVTDRYFEDIYGPGLDNAIVILSACESGGRFASELAEAMGGEDFVMLGWTEEVEVADANYASRRLFELLYQGLTVEEGLDILEDEGLKVFDYDDGLTTELTRYAPTGGNQRLVEIIQLEDNGVRLEDGASVRVDRSEGSDRLSLFARVDGILQEKKDQYAIQFELDGEPIGGTYDLSDAQQRGPYTYLVELEDVDTRQQLTESSYVLDAIVDLPEGGESRYSVNVTTQPCSFQVSISGNFGGSFDGAASIDFPSDGSLSIGFQSRDWIDGATGTDVFQGGLSTGPLNGPETTPSTYPITGASASHIDTIVAQSLVFTASYLAGTDFDCPTCEGDVVFDQISETSVSGSFSVKMPVHSPEPPDDQEQYKVTMSGSFTAVPGSSLDVGSPYFECRLTYVDD